MRWRLSREGRRAEGTNQMHKHKASSTTTRKRETQAARVARAAKVLGATRISGTTTWVHFAQETGTYWAVSERHLASLCDYIDDDDKTIANDAYSHWCAAGLGVEKPKGWRP